MWENSSAVTFVFSNPLSWQLYKGTEKKYTYRRSALTEGPCDLVLECLHQQEKMKTAEIIPRPLIWDELCYSCDLWITWILRLRNGILWMYDAEFPSVKSTSLRFILWEFLNVRINIRDWSKQPMGMEDQYMTRTRGKSYKSTFAFWVWLGLYLTWKLMHMQSFSRYGILSVLWISCARDVNLNICSCDWDIIDYN